MPALVETELAADDGDDDDDGNDAQQTRRNDGETSLFCFFVKLKLWPTIALTCIGMSCEWTPWGVLMTRSTESECLCVHSLSI